MAALAVLFVQMSLPAAAAAMQGPPARVSTEPTDVPAALPLFPSLVPQVNFWKRVYSEIDSHHGFVHDARHLDIIYDTILVPPGLSYRAERKFTKVYTQRVGLVLKKLAAGSRENLSAEEQQILTRWPVDVSAATLRQAAEQVRYQSGQKEKFLAGILRSRQWMPAIRAAIAEYNLPQELCALPHVESSFDMRAYSKARAAGIWQFTKATAHRFMNVNQAVDERYDPLTATRAAAQLLSENHRALLQWPLAITAYNHGAQGMRHAVKAAGTTDLSTIIETYQSRTFGFASRNFYTELLAAWEVSQHAETYFGTLPDVAPTRFVSVTCDAYYRAATLARALRISVAQLREHNPALRPAVFSHAHLVPRGYTVRLPEELVLGNAQLVAKDTQQPGAKGPEMQSLAPPSAEALGTLLAARLAAVPDSERFTTASTLVRTAAPQPRQMARNTAVGRHVPQGTVDRADSALPQRCFDASALQCEADDTGAAPTWLQ
jgi:membrane-bound lytic murein transglycosylase D